jgi:hypothetical protein
MVTVYDDAKLTVYDAPELFKPKKGFSFSILSKKYIKIVWKHIGWRDTTQKEYNIEVDKYGSGIIENIEIHNDYFITFFYSGVKYVLFGIEYPTVFILRREHTNIIDIIKDPYSNTLKIFFEFDSLLRRYTLSYHELNNQSTKCAVLEEANIAVSDYADIDKKDNVCMHVTNEMTYRAYNIIHYYCLKTQEGLKHYYIHHQ